MSTSQTNLQRFTVAKAEFIQDAWNLPLREGYVHGVAALDSRLMSAKFIPIFSYSHYKKVSILQMGLESSLTTTSPEFLDMQPVSLLVSQEHVAADVWFAALGDTPPPNYGVGGNPENQVGAPENTLPPMEPQTTSLLTAPPSPLVPTTTNVPIVPHQEKSNFLLLLFQSFFYLCKVNKDKSMGKKKKDTKNHLFLLMWKRKEKGTKGISLGYFSLFIIFSICCI